MDKKDTLKAHFQVKSKYLKYILTLLYKQDLREIALSVWFVVDGKFKWKFYDLVGFANKDADIVPFYGDENKDVLYISSPFEDNISFILPVKVIKRTVKSSLVKLQNHMVEKLIRFLPDDDILVDVYVYEDDDVGVFIILKFNEFAFIISEKEPLLTTSCSGVIEHI